jgi:hypothetical protein
VARFSDGNYPFPSFGDSPPESNVRRVLGHEWTAAGQSGAGPGAISPSQYSAGSGSELYRIMPASMRQEPEWPPSARHADRLRRLAAVAVIAGCVPAAWGLSLLPASGVTFTLLLLALLAIALTVALVIVRRG